MNHRKVLFFLLILMTMIITPISISAQNNNTYGWGYRKNNNHKTPEIGIYQDIINGTNTIFINETCPKTVYLTFDAGYDNGMFKDILKVLRKKNVKATFFITGDFVKRFPELTLQLLYDGHTIGNHSYHHLNITKLTDIELKKDLNELEEAFYKLTNTKMSNFFRPPEGVFNKKALQTLTSLGYTTVFWSIAYRDWQNNNQLQDNECVKKILDNLHPGAIILLHTVSKNNRDNLEAIIEGIINQGYQIDTLEQIKKLT